MPNPWTHPPQTSHALSEASESVFQGYSQNGFIIYTGLFAYTDTGFKDRWKTNRKYNVNQLGLRVEGVQLLQGEWGGAWV